MADYPASIYAPRTKENKAGVIYDANEKTVGFAEDITKLDAEVVAIETELMAAKNDNLMLELEESGVYTYIGKAEIASLTSGAVWRIFRIDETSGMEITWADGDDNYDNIWDNYLSLTYN